MRWVFASGRLRAAAVNDAGAASDAFSPGLPHALNDSSADKRIGVLRRVAAGCSISQAARDVGISYKAAWQAIDTLTNLSGFVLVDRTVGGSGGGGASITPHGTRLLALADELALARRQVLARFAGGVQFAAGLGLRTSMRNQLPCRVLACESPAPDDPMVRVRLTTSGGATLTASLTCESADLLGLVPGLAVLALCKATAVQITANAQPAGQSRQRAGSASVPALSPSQTQAASVCVLQGQVERMTVGVGQDEVVLALAGGGHWVGFAAHPFDGRIGDQVAARVPISALVVGLPG